MGGELYAIVDAIPTKAGFKSAYFFSLQSLLNAVNVSGKAKYINAIEAISYGVIIKFVNGLQKYYNEDNIVKCIVTMLISMFIAVSDTRDSKSLAIIVNDKLPDVFLTILKCSTELSSETYQLTLDAFIQLLSLVDQPEDLFENTEEYYDTLVEVLKQPGIHEEYVSRVTKLLNTGLKNADIAEKYMSKGIVNKLCEYLSQNQIINSNSNVIKNSIDNILVIIEQLSKYSKLAPDEIQSISRAASKYVKNKTIYNKLGNSIANNFNVDEVISNLYDALKSNSANKSELISSLSPLKFVGSAQSKICNSELLGLLLQEVTVNNNVEDVKSVCEMLSAIGNSLKYDDKLIANNAINTLIEALPDCDSEEKTCAIIKSISSLCNNVASAEQFLNYGGLKLVIELSNKYKSNDLLLAKLGLYTVISSHSNCAEYILDSDFPDLLNESLNSPNEELQQTCLELMANLLAYCENPISKNLIATVSTYLNNDIVHPSCIGVLNNAIAGFNELSLAQQNNNDSTLGTVEDLVEVSQKLLDISDFSVNSMSSTIKFFNDHIPDNKIRNLFEEVKLNFTDKQNQGKAMHQLYYLGQIDKLKNILKDDEEFIQSVRNVGNRVFKLKPSDEKQDQIMLYLNILSCISNAIGFIEALKEYYNRLTDPAIIEEQLRNPKYKYVKYFFDGIHSMIDNYGEMQEDEMNESVLFLNLKTNELSDSKMLLASTLSVIDKLLDTYTNAIAKLMMYAHTHIIILHKLEKYGVWEDVQITGYNILNKLLLYTDDAILQDLQENDIIGLIGNASALQSDNQTFKNLLQRIQAKCLPDDYKKTRIQNLIQKFEAASATTTHPAENGGILADLNMLLYSASDRKIAMNEGLIQYAEEFIDNNPYYHDDPDVVYAYLQLTSVIKNVTKNANCSKKIKQSDIVNRLENIVFEVAQPIIDGEVPFDNLTVETQEIIKNIISLLQNMDHNFKDNQSKYTPIINSIVESQNADKDSINMAVDYYKNIDQIPKGVLKDVVHKLFNNIQNGDESLSRRSCNNFKKIQNIRNFTEAKDSVNTDELYNLIDSNANHTKAPKLLEYIKQFENNNLTNDMVTKRLNIIYKVAKNLNNEEDASSCIGILNNVIKNALDKEALKDNRYIYEIIDECVSKARPGALLQPLQDIFGVIGTNRSIRSIIDDLKSSESMDDIKKVCTIFENTFADPNIEYSTKEDSFYDVCKLYTEKLHENDNNPEVCTYLTKSLHSIVKSLIALDLASAPQVISTVEQLYLGPICNNTIKLMNELSDCDDLYDSTVSLINDIYPHLDSSSILNIARDGLLKLSVDDLKYESITENFLSANKFIQNVLDCTEGTKMLDELTPEGDTIDGLINGIMESVSALNNNLTDQPKLIQYVQAGLNTMYKILDACDEDRRNELLDKVLPSLMQLAKSEDFLSSAIIKLLNLMPDSEEKTRKIDMLISDFQNLLENGELSDQKLKYSIIDFSDIMNNNTAIALKTGVPEIFIKCCNVIEHIPYIEILNNLIGAAENRAIASALNNDFIPLITRDSDFFINDNKLKELVTQLISTLGNHEIIDIKLKESDEIQELFDTLLTNVDSNSNLYHEIETASNKIKEAVMQNASLAVIYEKLKQMCKDGQPNEYLDITTSEYLLINRDFILMETLRQASTCVGTESDEQELIAGLSIIELILTWEPNHAQLEFYNLDTILINGYVNQQNLDIQNKLHDTTINICSVLENVKSSLAVNGLLKIALANMIDAGLINYEYDQTSEFRKLLTVISLICRSLVWMKNTNILNNLFVIFERIIHNKYEQQLLVPLLNIFIKIICDEFYGKYISAKENLTKYIGEELINKDLLYEVEIQATQFIKKLSFLRPFSFGAYKSNLTSNAIKYVVTKINNENDPMNQYNVAKILFALSNIFYQNKENLEIFERQNFLKVLLQIIQNSGNIDDIREINNCIGVFSILCNVTYKQDEMKKFIGKSKSTSEILNCILFHYNKKPKININITEKALKVISNLVLYPPNIHIFLSDGILNVFKTIFANENSSPEIKTAALKCAVNFIIDSDPAVLDEMSVLIDVIRQVLATNLQAMQSDIVVYSVSFLKCMSKAEKYALSTMKVIDTILEELKYSIKENEPLIAIINFLTVLSSHKNLLDELIKNNFISCLISILQNTDSVEVIYKILMLFNQVIQYKKYTQIILQHNFISLLCKKSHNNYVKIMLILIAEIIIKIIIQLSMNIDEGTHEVLYNDFIKEKHKAESVVYYNTFDENAGLTKEMSYNNSNNIEETNSYGMDDNNLDTINNDIDFIEMIDAEPVLIKKPFKSSIIALLNVAPNDFIFLISIIVSLLPIESINETEINNIINLMLILVTIKDQSIADLIYVVNFFNYIKEYITKITTFVDIEKICKIVINGTITADAKYFVKFLEFGQLSEKLYSFVYKPTLSHKQQKRLVKGLHAIYSNHINSGHISRKAFEPLQTFDSVTNLETVKDNEFVYGSGNLDKAIKQTIRNGVPAKLYDAEHIKGVSITLKGTFDLTSIVFSGNKIDLVFPILKLTNIKNGICSDILQEAKNSKLFLKESTCVCLTFGDFLVNLSFKSSSETAKMCKYIKLWRNAASYT